MELPARAKAGHSVDAAIVERSDENEGVLEGAGL